MDETNVSDDRVDSLLSSLSSQWTRADLTERTLDVVPELFACFTEVDSPESRSKTSVVAELVVWMSQVCSAKELFIALLEQAECFKDDAKFFALLQPIRRCIVRLHGDVARFRSLSIAMETLLAHVATLPRPRDVTDRTDEEPLVVDGRSERMVKVSSAFLDFLEPFIQSVSTMSLMHCRKDSEDQRGVRQASVSDVGRKGGGLGCDASQTLKSCDSLLEGSVTESRTSSVVSEADCDKGIKNIDECISGDDSVVNYLGGVKAGESSEEERSQQTGKSSETEQSLEVKRCRADSLTLIMMRLFGVSLAYVDLSEACGDASEGNLSSRSMAGKPRGPHAGTGQKCFGCCSCAQHSAAPKCGARSHGTVHESSCTGAGAPSCCCRSVDCLEPGGRTCPSCRSLADKQAASVKSLANSQSLDLANRCMVLMSHLQPDYVKSITNMLEEDAASKRRQSARQRKADHVTGEDADEGYSVEEPLPELGISLFTYLIFADAQSSQTRGNHVPSVYRHEFLFEFNARFICRLLRGPQTRLIAKGLRLCTSLVHRVAPCTLCAEGLDAAMREVFEAVIVVMTTSQVKRLARQAVALFRELMRASSGRGRRAVIEFVLEKVAHAGVQGLVITLLKDEIDGALKRSDTDSDEFTGPAVGRLLRTIFVLPKSAPFLELSNRTMSALNLLRYLVMRVTPACDTSGQIILCVRDAGATYLAKVRAEMESAHAEAIDELNFLKIEEKGATGGGEERIEMNVSLDGCNMADMTTEDKVSAMTSTLVTLDMMKSVVERIEECIKLQSTG